MAEIFGPKIAFLEGLEGDLRSIFAQLTHAITHTNEENIDFIKKQQAYIKEKYGGFLDYVYSDTGESCILPAYFVLQGLLYGDHSIERISKTSNDALKEYFLEDFCLLRTI